MNFNLDNPLKWLVRTAVIFNLVGYIHADETKWIAVGQLHNWYSSAGFEREVGRTGQIPDQQDGLRWPAQFRYQDSQAAKALWIGTTNYDDPIAGKNFSYKVVHVGPRVLDDVNEFIPVEFKMVGRYDHPIVLVDNVPASEMNYMDVVEEVDETLPVDRLLINEVNTAIGITMKRKIYALSQQNHDNYFIYDYVFVNTGIIDKDGTEHPQTLKDVQIFFQYRYAVSREGGPYGYYWLPQSTSWGHNTVNDARGENGNWGEFGTDPFRALFSWHGIHSLSSYNNIGGPNVDGDGRLGAAQYVGVITLHADKSSSDPSDDRFQPTTTQYIGSDEGITSGNDQFNAAQMADEWVAMTAGHPTQRHADASKCPNPVDCTGLVDTYGGTPGGYSQGQGFGPYEIAPGDSIHFVMAEGVNGLSRELCYTLGAEWLLGSAPFTLPDGSTTNDRDQFKNSWVYTGQDSLFQTFERAMNTYESGFNVPLPPPPPERFEVISGGDRIILKWADNAEASPNFDGYNVYRAIHVPDTTFELIYTCGGNSGNSIVNEYEDRSAIRGFDYYYYVTSFDDGSINDIKSGVPLESSLFYTRTNEPAYLRRAPGAMLKEIRVVPNPFNIKAKKLQYGDSDPDRILFLNLPPECKIRIYSERGDLIKEIDHTDGSGDEAWSSVTSSRQVVVSGLYIAHFETPEGREAIRKFVIIR